MLRVVIGLLLVLYVDSACLLNKLCTMVSGTSRLDPGGTTLHQFQRKATNFCIIIKKHGIHECYSDSNKVISIKNSLVGWYAMELIDLNDSTSQIMDLYVMQNVDQISFNSHINIEYPAFGSIVSKKLDIGISRTDETPLSSIHLSIAGVIELDLSPNTLQIESQKKDAEPGSVFYTITPRLSYVEDGTGGVRTLDGAPAFGYLEVVLSAEDIQSNRRYANYQLGSFLSQTTEDNTLQRSEKQIPPVRSPINICVFSGDKWDGQKQIWVQQSQYMDRTKYHFTWLVHLESHEVHNPRTSLNPVVRGIAHLNHITIAQNTNFMVDRNQLEEDPGDGTLPASAVWENDFRKLYQYAHARLIAANYSIDRITPSWCVQFYRNTQHTLQSQQCDIAAYGNQGGGSADVVILDTAAVLNIPTVGELQNLNVAADQVPTVLVAPSWFAAEHESVQRSVRAKRQSNSQGVQDKGRTANEIDSVVVIPPSVDAALFDPTLFHPATATTSNTTLSYRHPACVVSGDELQSESRHLPCVVIAFVARLSTEKHPGLFLQAAYEILQVYPFARFTIIGDGALRQSLETLADRLQIRWAVHFAGWVSAPDLPPLLAGVDIVINPSSETFGIANIEVMSMAVPLVTFALGGVGEYIQDPALSHPIKSIDKDGGSKNYHQDPQGDFEVSGNAVVVHRATPAALARAALYLIQRPALRRALGLRGRQTILDHFTVVRQMAQYDRLYSKLVEHSLH